ncbi:hypothetical protein SAMN06265222_11895 [Neorhodopirellula lusitana]|uniref:Uncharacterized protein n=1 Tax=Neorhodopirellula lusitana TaxID=445327 RepID=A0ABY1QMM3_9BACT|nr:hypothetical protein SAMN06265222_11895 [Neorhodopirellula lusitana]
MLKLRTSVTQMDQKRDLPETPDSATNPFARISSADTDRYAAKATRPRSIACTGAPCQRSNPQECAGESRR